MVPPITARKAHTAAPEGGGSARSGWLVAAEAAALAAFAVLLTAHAARTLRLLEGPGDAAALAVAALAALLAADLGSGLVHWICDSFFHVTTPLIGPAVIAPFREHHTDPLAITRRGFAEVNSSNCAVMLPPLALACWAAPPAAGSLTGLLGAGFLLFVAPAVLLTNQIHQWAHRAAVPRPVRWAQRRRLILPPAEHARHHEGGATVAYCITTGWLNRPLDRSGLLPALARMARPGRGRFPTLGRA